MILTGNSQSIFDDNLLRKHLGSALRMNCQLGECLVQCLISRRAGNEVPYNAAKSVGFHGRHFAEDVLDHGPADGGEGVAIVKTKRRKLVTLSANFQGLPERDFNSAR